MNPVSPSPSPLYLSGAPRAVRFRLWQPAIGYMHCPATDRTAPPYPFTGSLPSYRLAPEGFLMASLGDQVYRHAIHPNDLVLLMDTGLREGGAPTGRAIYEGDIVSFTIRGATHGREPDKCAAAHVWWHPEDAYWAFGRWVRDRQMWDGKGWVTNGTFTWWYTAMEDGFDHGSLKVLGNMFEHPNLLPLLGYIPQL